MVYVFLLVFASCLLHVLWNASGKKCGDSEAFTWLTTVGGALVNIVALCVLTLSGRIQPIPVSAGLLKMAATSGFFEGCYFIFLFWSYRHIDLSVAYPLSRGLAPLATLFLGPVVVLVFGLDSHRGIQLSQLLPVAIALGGASLLCYDALSRSDAKQNVLKGLILAMLTGLSIASYHLVDSTAMETYKLPSIQYLTLMSLFMSLFVSLWMLTKKNALARIAKELKGNIKGVLSVCCISNFTYCLVLLAFKLVKNATLVTAARNMGIVISLIYAAIFLKEKVSFQKALGACMITAGIIWIFLV